MDAVSEFLRALRPSRATLVEGCFMAPWRFVPPGMCRRPAARPSRAGRVAAFHIVVQGECFAEVAGHGRMRLVAGDALLLAHGDAHALLSPAPAGAAAQVLSGFVTWDALAPAAFARLPAAVHLPSCGRDADSWLEPAARHALCDLQSSRPGRDALASRLAEVLLIELLRLHLEPRAAAAPGWMAASNDRIVMATLEAVHTQPARAWTLASLARHVGSSRSVLAERFLQQVGITTMRYLLQWRMSLAAGLLSRSNAPLARIAAEVGYRTDTAFSRAFRREYDMPPAAWRRRQAAGRGGPASDHAGAPARPTPEERSAAWSACS